MPDKGCVSLDFETLGRPLQPARHQVTLSVDGQSPRWIVNQQILHSGFG